jgi:AcrR family transcriptional regulator
VSRLGELTWVGRYTKLLGKYTKTPKQMPPESSPDVRQRILDAALRLMAEHGFMELSQPKVAKAAGVRQSHLTYYFPTRGDLLRGVAVHSIETLLSSLRAGPAASGALTPEGFARFVGEALADKRRARVMLGLIVSSDEDREIKQFLREFVERVRQNLAVVASLLGRAPDPASIAAFHMLLVGATILNVARDDAVSRQECAQIAQMAVDTFLIGAAPAPAQERHRRTK